MLTTAALGSAIVLATAAAAAPPGATWSGDAYRSGVVCAGATGTSVLAAWPSAATGAPAFALAPVTAGPGGTHPSRVAGDVMSTRPYAGPAAAPLAVLLARHARPGAAASAITAAAVERLAGLDPIAGHCLDAGTSGLTRAQVVAAWAEAEQLAGPYTVRVRFDTTKLVMGRASTVSAQVTTASGTAVPGLSVSFTSATPDAHLAGGTAVTDPAGRARVTVSVPIGSSTRAVRVSAHLRLPGTPVVMSAPGEVSLVAAGPSHPLSRAARVPVDTTADPQPVVHVDRSLVLPGTVVHPSLTVAGMRGHDGTGQLSLRGPLPLRRGDGCRSYAAGATTQTGTAAATAQPTQVTQPQLDLSGDGAVASAPITLRRAGCYLLSADVTTSNATPNVHRDSGRQVITVAPVQVSVDPVGNGVNTAGRLAATVAVTGSVPARLTDVRARLLGPRPSDDGSCAAVRLPAAGAPLATTTVAGRLRLTSPRVATPGCYGFRVLGTVELPGLGSVPLAWSTPTGAAPTARTLVIAPTTAVEAVSAGSVTAGGPLGATVTVSGTYAQPGGLQLRLLHLPYDWRGCVGRDWTHADSVAATGPLTPTTGDGTYQVRSAAVPTSGCWTVVPVLTLRRNPAVSVADTAMIDPTAALTVLRPAAAPAAQRVPLQTAAGDTGGRTALTGAGMLAVLALAVGATLSIAVRNDSPSAQPGRHRP